MAALSADRKTNRRGEGYVAGEEMPIAANTTCWNGGMVANNNAGAMVPASDTANYTTLGVARQRMVNATGAPLAIFPPHPSYHAGCEFKLDNAVGGGSALTNSDIGKTCYVVDDHTVGKAAATANSIPAGTFVGFDPADNGVWVKFA